MRGHMKKAGMMPPTFESNRSANQFTARLLLHHLLDNDTFQWLAPYADYSLNNEQRLALVFVREVGAIDNITYRQLNSDINTSKASADLHDMCKKGLLEQKGQSKSSYYIAGEQFVNGRVDHSLNSIAAGENSNAVEGNSNAAGENSNAVEGNSNAIGENSNATRENSNAARENSNALPADLLERCKNLKKWESSEKMKSLIVELCAFTPLSVNDIAVIINRKPSSVRYLYTNPLVEDGKLFYTIPEMVKHPDQKYTSKK